MRNMNKASAGLVAVAVLCASGSVQGQAIEFFPVTGPGAETLPFSDAVRVGNLLYLSGQLGTTEDGLAPGGIAAETRQTLENIRASLERHGSSMERVVKCTVFLADMAEWDRMNEVYVTFFGENLPARSAIGTSGLALGARVEIECIAVVAGSSGEDAND